MIFLDILRDDSLNQKDLADKIKSKYKGMILNAFFNIYSFVLELTTWMY